MGLEVFFKKKNHKTLIKTKSLSLKTIGQGYTYTLLVSISSKFQKMKISYHWYLT
jgi:hypothetical protein